MDPEPRPSLAEIWSAHQDELSGLPPTPRRKESWLIWRKTIDKSARDYTNLVGVHPMRERITHLEVEAILHCYVFGYMAGREWIGSAQALHEANVRGWRVRDRLSELGVPLDEANAGIGLAMGEALGKIVELGMADGTSARCAGSPN